MKPILKTVLLFTALLMLSIGFSLQSAAETEPNNNYATANSIKLNAVVSGALDTSVEDHDWYCFSLSEETPIKLCFSAPAEASTNKRWYFTLLDDKNQLKEFCRVPASAEFETSFEITLEAGDYYIEVSSQGGYYSSSEYLFRVETQEDDSHTCDLTEVPRREATCTEDGNILYFECEECGKRFDENGNEVQSVTIRSSGHSWGAFVQTRKPTCNEDGEETAQCEICLEKKSQSITKLRHKLNTVWTVDKAPSCEESGLESRHCLNDGCTYRVDERELSARGHQMQNATRIEIENPTCLQNGVKKTYCTVENCDGYQVEELSALDHLLSDEWTVDTEATCSKVGSKSHHCTREDCDYKEDVTEIPMSEHQMETFESKEATCKEGGVLTQICKDCGNQKDTLIPLRQHEFGEWQQTEAPTCAAEGKNTKTCNGCGISKVEAIAKLPHSYSEEWTLDLAPTCLNAGKKSRHCINCDAFTDLSEVESLGHDFASDYLVDRAPTCETVGSQSKHCSRCEERGDVTEIPALGHSFGEWIVEIAPTCEGIGRETRTCSACGASETKNGAAALGHSFGEWIVEIAPTCEGLGREKRTCSACGTSETKNGTAALGHSFGEWYVSVAPTCVKKMQEKRHCTACNRTETRESEDALGHDFGEFVVDMEATCEAAGSKSKHCSRCDACDEETVIPALGHSFGGWSIGSFPTCEKKGTVIHACVTCGHVETKDGANELGHDFETEFVEDKPPSCEAAGSRSKHCSRCDAKGESEAIPPSGHRYGEWSMIAEPTCTEMGKAQRCCLDCPKTETRESNGALGHDFSAEFNVDKLPSCEETGIRSKYCSRCGASGDTETIAATGHFFGVWSVKTAPTCTASGTEQRSCSVCQASEIREGESAVGHSFESHFTVDIAATCSMVGSQSRHCEQCDARTDVTELPKISHSYDDGVITVYATAESRGSKRFTCTACGDWYEAETEKLPPVMLEISEAEWKTNSKDSVSFRSAASLEDFLELRINGESVPRSCYVLSAGSTVVELTSDYLKSLEGGVYTLEIVSTTGVASAEFSVLETDVAWWIFAVPVGIVAIGVAVWLPLSRKKNRAHLELVASEIENCLKTPENPDREEAAKTEA